MAGCEPRKPTWRMSTLPARLMSSPTKCGTEPGAGEPKLAPVGLALHHSRNSGTVFTEAGTCGPTANPMSNTTPSETGVTSVTGS
ncbi:hypothetical protein D3C72_2409050 [compost metagenome]